MIKFFASNPNSFLTSVTLTSSVVTLIALLILLMPLLVNWQNSTRLAKIFTVKVAVFIGWTTPLLLSRLLTLNPEVYNNPHRLLPDYFTWMILAEATILMFSSVTSLHFVLTWRKTRKYSWLLGVAYGYATLFAIVLLSKPSLLVNRFLITSSRTVSFDTTMLGAIGLSIGVLIAFISLAFLVQIKKREALFFAVHQLLINATFIWTALDPSVADTSNASIMIMLSTLSLGCLYWINADINPARQAYAARTYALKQAQIALQTTETNLERTELLNRLGRLLNTSIESETLFTTLVQETHAAFDARRTFLDVIDLNNKEILANHYAGYQFSPEAETLNWDMMEVGLLKWVIDHQEIAIISGTTADPRQTPRIASWMSTHKIGPLMVCPVVSRGDVLGIIGVLGHTDTPDFTIDQAEFFTAIAAQAAIAIRNSRLFKQQQQARLRAEIMFNVTQAANEQDDLDSLLNTILYTYHAQASNKWVMLHLLNQKTETVSNSIYLGPEGLDMTYTYAQLMDGLIGHAFRQRQTLLSLPEEQDDREAARYQERRKQLQFGSVMCAPLIHQNASVGVITVINGADMQHHTQDDMDLLTAVANQMANTITNFKAADRLRQSEQQFRTLIHNAPEAIIILDADRNRFIEANPVASALLGYSIDDLLTMSPKDMLVDRQGVILDHAEIVFAALKSGNSVFEVELRRANGEIFLAELRTLVLPDEERKLIRGSVVDITERKRQELAMLQSQKLESLGVMAGGIAHDFNNLLLAIMGQSQIVQRRLDPAHKALKNVQKIEKAATRASELTRQMMAYAGRGQSTERTLLDVNNLIEENAELLRVTISDNVDLKLDLMQAPPKIMAELGQIQQVIMNMMINASEAIGKDPGRLTVTTRLATVEKQDLQDWQTVTPDFAPGDYICLEFQDTGCGMNAETKARIFDPFFTTKNSGHGLGLAAVLGILRSHKGSIQVHSNVGIGTRFDIVFPIESTVKITALEQFSQLDPQHLSGRTILVVDDEETVLETLTESLRSYNMHVYSATSGVAGLQLFAAHRDEIELTLLDVSMPGISGVETMHRLHRECPEAKVILSSGYNRLDADKLADVEENVAFLQKPYRTEQLMSLICNTLPIAD